jgi:hypothetical protein
MLIPIFWRPATNCGFFLVLIVQGVGGFFDPTSSRVFPPACAAFGLLAPTTSTFNVLLEVLMPTLSIVRLKRKRFVPNALLILREFYQFS